MSVQFQGLKLRTETGGERSVGWGSKKVMPPTFLSETKGIAVPLQAWSSPEGSRKLRFPDFMTTVEDGGKVVSLTHWLPLPPGNTPGTHFC